MPRCPPSVRRTGAPRWYWGQLPRAAGGCGPPPLSSPRRRLGRGPARRRRSSRTGVGGGEGAPPGGPPPRPVPTGWLYFRPAEGGGRGESRAAFPLRGLPGFPGFPGSPGSPAPRPHDGSASRGANAGFAAPPWGVGGAHEFGRRKRAALLRLRLVGDRRGERAPEAGRGADSGEERRHREGGGRRRPGEEPPPPPPRTGLAPFQTIHPSGRGEPTGTIISRIARNGWPSWRGTGAAPKSIGLLRGVLPA